MWYNVFRVEFTFISFVGQKSDLYIEFHNRFKVDEFLTAGQIQSFFSRTAAKLRYAVSPDDDDDETDDNNRAAEDDEAFSDACTPS